MSPVFLEDFFRMAPVFSSSCSAAVWHGAALLEVAAPDFL